MILDKYPLCTIMIPTYNQVEYLKRTIDSALAQDYPNIEVIVADDHSSDSTVSLLESYTDKKISWHTNNPNLGRVDNYHDLLYVHAKGKWVVNLDGDDFFIDTTFISAAVEAAETDTETVIVFADRFEKKDPVPEMKYTSDSHDAPVEYFDGLEYLLSWPRKDKRIHHLTALYCREKALETGFYTEDIISSDYESLFRLMPSGKVAYIPAKAAVWRHHENNASVKKTSNDKIKDLIFFDNVATYISINFPEYKKYMPHWLLRNISRKYYGFLLDAWIRNDFTSLRLLEADIDKRYPGISSKVCHSPKTWFKIFCHWMLFQVKRGCRLFR